MLNQVQLFFYVTFLFINIFNYKFLLEICIRYEETLKKEKKKE
jgi:hypothetical protein